MNISPYSQLKHLHKSDADRSRWERGNVTPTARKFALSEDSSFDERGRKVRNNVVLIAIPTSFSIEANFLSNSNVIIIYLIIPSSHPKSAKFYHYQNSNVCQNSNVADKDPLGLTDGLAPRLRSQNIAIIVLFSVFFRVTFSRTVLVTLIYGHAG